YIVEDIPEMRTNYQLASGGIAPKRELYKARIVGTLQLEDSLSEEDGRTEWIKINQEGGTTYFDAVRGSFSALSIGHTTNNLSGHATLDVLGNMMVSGSGEFGSNIKATSLDILNGDNRFKYDGGADLVLKFGAYGSGGRALVHESNNRLTINYNNDFDGGTIIGSELLVNGNLNTLGNLKTTGTGEFNNILSGGNGEFDGHILAKSFSSVEDGQMSISNPSGGRARFHDFGHVGTIKITLPQSWKHGPIRMLIKVYDYTLHEAFELRAGGYLLDNHDPKWYRTYAYIINDPEASRNLPVRFGHDGEKCCLYIGDIDSTWDDFRVTVSEVEFSVESNVEVWNSGWKISLETEHLNINDTHTKTQVGRYVEGNEVYHTANANLSTVDWAANNLMITGTAEFGDDLNVKSGNLHLYNKVDNNRRLTINGNVSHEVSIYNYDEDSTEILPLRLGTNNLTKGLLISDTTANLFGDLKVNGNIGVEVSEPKARLSLKYSSNPGIGMLNLDWTVEKDWNNSGSNWAGYLGFNAARKDEDEKDYYARGNHYTLRTVFEGSNYGFRWLGENTMPDWGEDTPAAQLDELMNLTQFGDLKVANDGHFGRYVYSQGTLIQSDIRSKEDICC
ncbi:hypothetical protein, partial [Xanthovirga aplysinae]|uniref:hypothetical protein n=1 Tax=Xanthovirga aplysinae TaxID=2529853 RepID=UPI001656B4E9